MALRLTQSSRKLHSVKTAIVREFVPGVEALGFDVCVCHTSKERSELCSISAPTFPSQLNRLRSLSRPNSLHSIRVMYYPIDFSETRKRKKKKSVEFQLPKLPPYAWLGIAVPVLFACLLIGYLDYSAMSKASSVIRQIEEIQATGGRRQKSRVRKLTGISPKTDVRGRELHETYTFSRVIPILPRPVATVVYSSGGSVIDVLSPAEVREKRNRNPDT